MRARPVALFLSIAAAGMASAVPDGWRGEVPLTDVSTTTITDWSGIVPGGPPRDGIPALSDPSVRPAARDSRLSDREPVIAVEIEGAVPRACPIRYPTWHEIVNDEIAGIPVAVTFRPLCNSGPTFDRRVGGRVLTFGVSGRLRHSDMVMYDRATESWWQQAAGEGIVGGMTGVEPVQLPAWMEGRAEFRARNPQGLVMDAPDWPRPCGRNPHVGYDSSVRPLLQSGELPPHGILALACPVRVGDRAWPVERVRETGQVREDGVSRSGRSASATGRAATCPTT